VSIQPTHPSPHISFDVPAYTLVIKYTRNEVVPVSQTDLVHLLLLHCIEGISRRVHSSRAAAPILSLPVSSECWRRRWGLLIGVRALSRIKKNDAELTSFGSNLERQKCQYRSVSSDTGCRMKFDREVGAFDA